MDEKCRQLLVDAMTMLKDMEYEGRKGRPSYWQVKKQYIALGKEIEEYLNKTK